MKCVFLPQKGSQNRRNALRSLALVIATLSFLLTAAVPAGAASLASLKVASCDFYAVNRADLAACLASPTCLATEEVGAYYRDGGPTSKLAKMCNFRVDQFAAACAAGNMAVVHFVADQARKAMENWIGQSLKYCQRGQMSCAHVIERFGAAWVSQADFVGLFEVAKRHVWAIAERLPEQAKVEPLALSILAELYNRLDTPTACEDE